MDNSPAHVWTHIRPVKIPCTFITAMALPMVHIRELFVSSTPALTPLLIKLLFPNLVFKIKWPQAELHTSSLKTKQQQQQRNLGVGVERAFMACQQVSIEAHVGGIPFRLVLNVKEQLSPGPALTVFSFCQVRHFRRGIRGRAGPWLTLLRTSAGPLEPPEQPKSHD